MLPPQTTYIRICQSRSPTNRTLIGISKMAFHILDGVVLLHESLHEICGKKRKNAITFKVDFGKKKMYDNINWNFLFSVLAMKGFPYHYIIWVRQFVEGQHVAAGGPLSFILFNIDVDVPQ